MKSSVYHHFIDHSYCGEWCHVKRKLVHDPSIAMKYRCKVKDKIFFQQAIKILDEFTTEARLREMYFGGDSQKCERKNGLVSLVAPKDRTYCGSNSLSGRVALVYILDSLKLSSTVRTILKELGFSTDVSTIRRDYKKLMKSLMTKTYIGVRQRQRDDV